MNGLRAALTAWFLRNGLQVLILLAGLGVVFVGLMELTRITRDKVRDSDRYTALFRDIDCTPPPEKSRADFLNEVRYLTDFPEKLRLLDDDLQERLYKAFGQHPWVEKVERVEIVPPRLIHVSLVYRTPVLAVMREEEGSSRLIGVADRRGIVLPASAYSKELPAFEGGKNPGGRAGSLWGDEGVTAAARTAWYLRPHQEKLHVTGFKAVGSGLVIATQDGASILWGRAPGLEEPGEAPASKKLERLLKYCSEKSPDRPASAPGYDVRPLKERSR